MYIVLIMYVSETLKHYTFGPAWGPYSFWGNRSGRSRNGERKLVVMIMTRQSSLTNVAISFYLDEKDKGYATHQKKTLIDFMSKRN